MPKKKRNPKKATANPSLPVPAQPTQRGSGLTVGQLQQLADRLRGTADSIQRGIETLEINPDDFDVNEVESELLDHNCECCKGCGWWFETHELVPDEEEYDNEDEETEKTGHCQDCR